MNRQKRKSTIVHQESFSLMTKICTSFPSIKTQKKEKDRRSERSKERRKKERKEGERVGERKEENSE